MVLKKFPKAGKLYVFDGGTIEYIDVTGSGLKKEEVSFYRFPALVSW